MFEDGERQFGNGAVGFAVRKPAETYLWAHKYGFVNPLIAHAKILFDVDEVLVFLS